MSTCDLRISLEASAARLPGRGDASAGLGFDLLSLIVGINPKPQNSPKAFHSMVYRPKSLNT